MLEKGRLYSLRKDGTKDSLYLNIKNKRFLFGSSEYCTVRIYIDGIFPEHCVLTIGGQGKAYLEPLHPSALTLVNGIKIKHKVCLEDNDVVTVFIKEFQFAYPPNSLSRIVSFERLILAYSKQMKPAQKFEILTIGKNWETSHPFTESSVSNIDYIPKKQICIIASDIFKKIPEYLLKFTYQEPVNILYEKMNAQGVDSSCPDKFLIKYRNQYVKESPEERRNLALKLYEFISFLRGLLNRNEEYLYDLCPVLESVWKYCVARAIEDILFLPLKSLNLKGEITVHKKSLQSRILSCTSKNSSPVSDTMSEKKNHCINSLEDNMTSDCKMDGQKQNQYLSRKISISYKKRVSLAVKRYHLRKRKSIMMAKAAEIGSVENFELLGERPQMKERCREINSDELDVVLNLEKQQTTRAKRKRGYNKKEKEELQVEGDLKISLKQESEKESIECSAGEQTTNTKLTETKSTKRSYKKKKEAITNKTALKDGMETKLTHDLPMKQNITSETKEIKSKKRNYKKKKEVSLEKTGLYLKDGMETKLTHDLPMKQNITSETKEIKSKKRNYKKKKEVSLEKTGLCKSTQECGTQELSCCQRITRSMAKSRH